MWQVWQVWQDFGRGITRTLKTKKAIAIQLRQTKKNLSPLPIYRPLRKFCHTCHTCPIASVKPLDL
jgi:hypothetical protein